LRSLKILDLSGTKIEGNLAPLRDLSELKHLLVQELSLDAAALAAIGDIPALSRLTLRGANYPPEALAQLRKARPELAVDE
jgi:hypothetical protein